MFKESIIELYERDLTQLRKEIEQYKDEASLWKLKEGINNSAGNLALHVVGGLNHFIGAGMGNTGYVRNRDAEFTTKNIPQKELLAEIDKAIGMIKSTVNRLSDADFEKDFHIQIQGKTVKIGHALTHLLAHLNYHLGQVNYHRRLVA